MTSANTGTIGVFEEGKQQFPADEQATLLGAPGKPPIAVGTKVLYGCIGFLLAMTSGLGSGMVIVNAPYLLGALGGTTRDLAWITTAYVIGTVSMNLLIIRFRQQYGFRLFTMLGLIAFSIFALFHLFEGSLTSAIVVQALFGAAAAPMTVMAVQFWSFAVPPAMSTVGVSLAIGLQQTATPLARAFSSDLLALAQWRSISLFELGLALLCLGAVGIVRLPNSAPEKAIQAIDIVTFVLFATGTGLLCAVLGLGRLDWWTDSPWLGWALAGSIPLIAAALFIERGRATPLLDLQFLTTPLYLRFAALLIIGRIIFSEQASVAIALLGTLGVNNDESVKFGVVLTLASLAGAVSAAFLFKPNRGGWMVVASLLTAAVSAQLDSHATNLTRPTELYLTQAMFSFAMTFFIGPAVLFGIGPVLKAGGKQLVSFVLLFAFTQNVGSLLGASLLGTLQVIFEKADSSIIAERITQADPEVAARLTTSAQSLASTISDPAYQQAEAIVTLQGQVTTEANVLAYNQVFTLVAVLSALTAIALISVLLWTAWKAQVAKRRTQQGASA